MYTSEIHASIAHIQRGSTFEIRRRSYVEHLSRQMQFKQYR